MSHAKQEQEVLAGVAHEMVVESAVAHPQPQPEPEPEPEPEPAQDQPPLEADDSPVANEESVDGVMKKLSGITATITMLKELGSTGDDLKALISEQDILQRGIIDILGGNITQDEFLRQFKNMSLRQEKVGILDRKIANITDTITMLRESEVSEDDLKVLISDKEFLKKGVELVLTGSTTQDEYLNLYKNRGALQHVI